MEDILTAAIARAGELISRFHYDRPGLPALCDHCLRVPSDVTPRIREGHITIGQLIEQQLFPQAG